MRWWSRRLILFSSSSFTAGVRCPTSLPLYLPCLSKKPLVGLRTTDLMTSWGPMGFLTVGLWYLGKGWAHTWALPYKAWLLPAYFRISKDIHCFLISVLLGIMQLQLAVRLSLTRGKGGDRGTDRHMCGVSSFAQEKKPVLLFRTNVSVSAGLVGQPQALSLIAETSQINRSVALIKTSYVGSISTARGGSFAVWPTLICPQRSRGPTSAVSLNPCCISSHCLHVRWGVTPGLDGKLRHKEFFNSLRETMTAQLV